MKNVRRAIVTMPVLAFGAFVTGLPGRLAAQRATPSIEVWKSPSCGCCKDWAKHMQDNGFRVTVNDSGNTAMRARAGIPGNLGSCHTAVVAGYAIEGHVPADDIRRLLSEKPTAIGLAVPGMPIGSPGMDGPEYRGRKDAYEVLLVKRDGTTSVYRSYS
ncbi:MAG: DUF411 domain-containing protein [Burkholderiaceae bacterium]|nr:DUF411 domain-containing protein [Burkholderiaceae bacterium]